MQGTESAVIKWAYACRDDTVCLQAERVFTGLPDSDDNFSESPTVAAVAPCFNGPVLCQWKKTFSRKRLLCAAEETVPTPPAYLAFQFFVSFFFPSPQCFAGVSWRAADSQSSTQKLLLECGGRGEWDGDGWCWSVFSYWPEKLDHIVCHQEKCPIKTCQYGPSITPQMFTCVSGAYHWAGACADGLTCLKADGICWTESLHKQCKYPPKNDFLFDQMHRLCNRTAA